MIREVVDFSTAVAKFTANGFEVVSREEYNRRMGICVECGMKLGFICPECNCVMFVKAVAALSSCRKNKWNRE
jgi:hypothetical protein